MKQSAAVAAAVKAYREALVRQAAMPAADQWKMGAEIKALKAKAYVEIEVSKLGS